MNIELKDLMLIKLYFQSKYTMKRRKEEFNQVLQKYNLTEEQARQIAEEFDF